MKHRILLVEDEPDLGNVVKQYLEIMDFEVDWQQNGKAALTAFSSTPEQYQVLLIDVNLPEMDGFELARQVVSTGSNVPFLFLTARSERADKLYGLKIGADDYMVKPFDVDELVLRIRNIIRRKQPPAQEPPSVITIGNARFYKDSLTLITGDNREISLTPKERDLLLHLYHNSNKVIRREDILNQVWGSDDYFLGRSLDVFISRFRKYFRHNQYISIRNVYGIGFMFSIKQ